MNILCFLNIDKLLKNKKKLTASKPYALESFIQYSSKVSKKISTINWWRGENDRMTYKAIFIVGSNFGVCLWNVKDEWFLYRAIQTIAVSRRGFGFLCG